MLRGALKHTAVHLNHQRWTIQNLDLSDMKQRYLKRFRCFIIVTIFYML